MTTSSNTHHIHCNFCGKSRNDVAKLIVANNAGICNECISLAATILNKETNDVIRKDKRVARALDPLKIRSYLDEYIIGQDAAKIAISVGVVNHYKRAFLESDIELEKSNIMLYGPTGSGKTLIAKTIAKYLNVPFIIADATTLTEAGYVGDDVETVISGLLAAADGDVGLCEQGIVFLDEVDKISRKSEGPNVRDVSGEGVQQALLKLVEGTKCRVPLPSSKKLAGTEYVEVDTSKILFIAGGAFTGLEKIVERRQRGASIGFSSQGNNVDSQEVLPDDFIKFGMIPEFVGRFPISVGVDKLSKDDFVHILTAPKNNIIAQMQFYFTSDDVELVFSPESINEIAEQAFSQDIGARGLKSIVEKTLMPYMYTLGEIKRQGFKKIIITPGVVKNGQSPEFIE